MHLGIQSFIRWIDANPAFPGLAMGDAASVADLAIIEDNIAAPLPEDLRQLLRRFNGGQLPTGQLLSAGPRGDDSIGGALDDLAERLGKSPRDPELLLPFFRTDEGGLLAFDRSAGPVSDTWPIVDFYLDSGELRLVHRTLDGWCRSAVAEWGAEDFEAPFSLDKYLAAGQRHVEIEPDVSVAHATVAHALRRAGRPEEALGNYLCAARCIPAQPWCDWEALKIATLMRDGRAAMEAANRLAARAPAERWAERDTRPSMVADVLGVVSELRPAREALLRLFDQLSEQTQDEAELGRVTAIRRSIFEGNPPPPTLPVRPTAVPPQHDLDAWLAAVHQAYEQGQVRDDDLLLDPAYQTLRRQRDLSQVLRIARGF